MNYFKKKDGVTLMILTITIIVLLILAGISVTAGKEVIERARAESALTNMITIKAKSKGYLEEINSKVWDVQDKVADRKRLFAEKYKMNFIESNQEMISKTKFQNQDLSKYECYRITLETLEIMGLNKIVENIDDEEYVVIYNTENFDELDIYLRKGVEYKNEMYYTFSSLQNKMN